MGTTKSIYLHVARHDVPGAPPIQRPRLLVETANFFEEFRWALDCRIDGLLEAKSTNLTKT